MSLLLTDGALERIDNNHTVGIPDAIHVALGDLDNEVPETILTPGEQNEYNSFRNSARKVEYLSTRQLLKDLGMQLGLETEQFEIRKDRMGKPHGIYKDRDYFLSMAHAGPKILCGISETHSLGVDLEPVDRSVSEGVRERMLHPDERESLRSISLVRLWTVKEALVKLEGKGLRTNLNEIQIEHTGEQQFKGIFSKEKSAKICSFQQAGYWIAIAFFQPLTKD